MHAVEACGEGRVTMGLKGISRRSFVGGAALAAGAAALAGCGTSGHEAGGDGQASKVAAKLTFCLDYTPNTNHTGIYVAQHEGYFAAEGLEVQIVQPAEDGAEAMVGSGQAQLGVSYQDYLANAFVGADLPIQAVAAVIQHNTSGIMSRAADGIASARLMENHSYATWGLAVEQATIKQVMETDGGDFSKLKMVPYAVDDEVAGLRANMFDCVWVFEGWAVQNAVVQDFAHNYFSFIDMDDVFDFYTPVIAANNAFCAQSPEVVRAFLRAVRRGYEFAVKDPERAADILCEEVPELDAALVKQSQLFLAGHYIADAASWGRIDAARWSRFFQWLNDNALVEKPLDVNAGFTMEYLD